MQNHGLKGFGFDPLKGESLKLLLLIGFIRFKRVDAQLKRNKSKYNEVIISHNANCSSVYRRKTIALHRKQQKEQENKDHNS